MRRQVFNTLQGLFLSGVRATLKLISFCFVWFEVNMDVRNCARTCRYYQGANVIWHTKAPLETLACPEVKFWHIRIDIVGPLSPSNGHPYFLAYIDRYAQWPDAIFLRDTTASNVVTTYLNVVLKQ